MVLPHPLLQSHLFAPLLHRLVFWPLDNPPDAMKTKKLMHFTFENQDA
jgi:hypothetical protein